MISASVIIIQGEKMADLFGMRLRTLREQKGFTQKELSEMLGVSAGTVGMWEQGRRTPPVSTLERIGALLGVGAAAFIDDRPELTDAEVEQLGKWTVEDDFKELFEKIYRLDEYGQAMVEQMVMTEFRRCAEQKTLRGLDITVDFFK